MPPPRMTTLVPLPEPASCSTLAAAEAEIGNSPRDCIIVKAALYPPAWPTLIRKSRLLRLIFDPPYDLPNGHVRQIWMVELEFSGLLSMSEQAPSWQRRVPCGPHFMMRQLASALSYLDA